MSDDVKLKFTAQDDLSKAVDRINSRMGQLEKQTPKTAKSVDLFGKAAKTAVLSVGGLVSAMGALRFAKSAMSNAVENIRAEQKLEQVVRATGQAAGLTAEQLKSMAGELSQVTTNTGAAIMQTQAMLLTFKNIGQETFPRALEAAADMGEMFGGMEQASIQLGKALNDPVKGVTALQRQGIQFTDSQRGMIRAFVEAGDVASAQGMILEELEGQFGGVARAMAETDDGRIQTLKNNLADLQAELGLKLLPVVKEFYEILHSAATFIVDNMEALAMSAVTTGLVLLTPSVISATTAFKGFTLALKVNPIIAAATAVAGLTFAIVQYKKNADTTKENQRSLENMQRLTAQVKETKAEIERITSLLEAVDKGVQVNGQEFINYGGSIDGARERLKLLEERLESTQGRLKKAAGISHPVAVADVGGPVAVSGGAVTEAVVEDNSKLLRQMELDLMEKEERELAIIKDKYEERKAILGENAQLHKWFTEMSTQVEEKYQQQRVALEEAAKQRRIESRMQEIDEEIRLEQEKIAAFEEMQLEIAEREEELHEERLQKLAAWTHAAQSAANNVASVISAVSSARLSELEAEKKTEIDIIKSSRKSRRQQAKEIAKIQEEMEEARKEQALKEWRQSLIMAIVNTALGVTKSFATTPPPAGIPFAAAVGVAGAASAAVIAANKPKFARGGIVEGQSFSGDNVDVAVNSGEGIFTREQQKQLFNMANGRGGGGGNTSIGDTSIVINGDASPDTVNQIDGVLTNHRQQIVEMLYDASSRGEIDATRLALV